MSAATSSPIGLENTRTSLATLARCEAYAGGISFCRSRRDLGLADRHTGGIAGVSTAMAHRRQFAIADASNARLSR
jgi:hypothetical protein